MSVPNPGSDEAQEQGCTCPAGDNHYGEGISLPDLNNEGETITVWWKRGDCPLHGRKGE